MEQRRLCHIPRMNYYCSQASSMDPQILDQIVWFENVYKIENDRMLTKKYPGRNVRIEGSEPTKLFWNPSSWFQ